jgi:hypothetical protein
MAHRTRSRTRCQVEHLRRSFAQADGLPFADVLPAGRIERAIREEHAEWREATFTPALTLWAFLAQVVSPTACCRAAVGRVMAWLVARGEPPCGPGTGGYCKARGRLPEGLVRRLMRETGRALHDATPDRWLWRGRRVLIADGTGVSMPDTPANRAEYPQPGSQAAGVGFPQLRLVALFSLSIGAVVDAAIGPSRGKGTGEPALLRSIADAVARGSVVLADRYFGGWFDLALWQARGVDVVVRLHQKRATDFRRGWRIATGDHAVRWGKPQRPAWMTRADYLALPGELFVREVRVRVAQPGFRTQSLVVATTITDRGVTAAEIGDLYRRRWSVELDLRSVKVTLGMDVLRCQSPGMVRKEVWAHLLAYNLLRTVMAQAAEAGGCEPRELSVAGTVQGLAAFAGTLATDTGVEVLVAFVLAYRVGNRPDRVEPRMRKRRPKAYPPLPVPRAEARRRLLHSR